MKAVVAGVAALLAAGCVVGAIAYAKTRSDLHEMRAGLERQERLTDQARNSSERYFSDADELHDRLRDLRARLEGQVGRNDRLTRRFHDFFCFVGRPPRSFIRPPRRADVTGDGSLDSVRLVGFPTGEQECRYELRVQTAGGRHHLKTYRAPSGYSSIHPGVLFAELNMTGGQEIFVQTGIGAYATYGKLYTLVNGSLQRIRGMGGSQWIYGASAGNGSQFDCPTRGTVIRTSWTYASDFRGHEVTRRTYRVDGAQANLVDRDVFLMREWDHDRIAMVNPCFPGGS